MDKKRIVIVGAGFAGVYTYRRLCKLLRGRKDTEVILVNPRNYFLFTPLLHEVATGGIPPEHTTEPLRKVLGCDHSSLLIARLESVNEEEKKIMLSIGSLNYDYLILTVGAKANLPKVVGEKSKVLTLNTMEDAIVLKNRLIEVFEEVERKPREEWKNLLSFIIIGGGPTGVELASEMSELILNTFSKYYPREFMENVSIHLIHKDKELVGMFAPYVRKKAKSILGRQGVTVYTDCAVTWVGSDYVETSAGRIEGETIIWTGGVVPVDVSFLRNVDRTSDGRIVVNDYLEIPSHSEIFALGDIAYIKDSRFPNGVPGLAQSAVQEAKVAADNIYAMIAGKKKRKFYFRPKGELLSLGQWQAAGRVLGFNVSGPFAWWLWRTVYLFKIISWTKKFKVALDWTINIFYPRDISELYRPEKSS